MENINIWESNFKDNYIYFNNLSDYFQYLTEKKLPMTFLLKDMYISGNEPQNVLENKALRENINLIFTDEEHPIVISNFDDFIDSYINPSFFEQHKEEFIKLAKENIKNQLIDNSNYIYIPDFISKESILDEIIKEYNLNISTEDLLYKTYYFYQITNKSLSEETIQKIKDNHLEFYIENESGSQKISTNKVIGYHTIKELKELKRISIDIPIKRKEVDNFIYINDSATIRLTPESNSIDDEKTFFHNLKNIFTILATHNKKYNITFEVKNRELLRQSQLLDNIPSNINIIIKNDLFDYDLDTYLKEEAKLEKLIAPIRQVNLSPLEKYLAVYNIVKQFKEYKENKENKEESRFIRFILDNEYIVCVGFQTLLKNLLDKVEIPSYEISTLIDKSYDSGFTMEDICLDYAGHARNLVKIDDDKYNVHGIYLADATWDNYMDKDIYINSLLTFDRKKEAFNLEKLYNEDLLLDFHNFDEFNKKINYLIQKEIRKKRNHNKEKEISEETLKSLNATLEELKLPKTTEEKLIADEYQYIYSQIMKILKETDYEKYVYFYNKYKTKMSNWLTPLKDIEPIACQFLTEYAEYIIALSNKQISLPTIIEAAKVVKEKIDGYDKEKIDEWMKKTIEDNLLISARAFPYHYDPNNQTEAYLTSVDEKPEIKENKTR